MRSPIRMFSIAFATLLLSLLVFASQSVQAATLIVSTTADAGAGSLRQAIIDATSNAAANTINFNIPLTDSGYNSTTDRFTITLVSALPDLPLAPLTIDNMMGRGLTVKGNNTFRIFTLVNSAVVNLNNLTISQGSSNGGLGGGIYMGDSSVLFLTNCVVSNNSATNGGGGIWVNDSGTLHVIDSTISNNTAMNGGGGGIYINNSGTLNITSSTVSGNTATVGGGGGIYNGVTGTVNATSITVNGNTAGDLGGGINTIATLTLNSSTISGNTATNGGGGIYNNFTATLNNSLIALNTGADGPDLLGRGSRGNPFTGTSNLIGNADGSEAFGPTTNQLGSTGSPINPRLGPLQDNGGPTFTQAVLAGSPAIDAGATALATDQRGVSRPQNGDGLGGAQSDIGSFESEGQPELTINDVTVAEPASGSTSAIFTVSLSRVNGVAVSVDFATADGTTSAGSDYTAAVGTLVFAPGELTKTVTVTVLGDIGTESPETFTVNLRNVQGGARVPDNQGIGTILDTAAAPTPTPTPTPKTDQTIDFGPLSSKTFGDASFNVSATSSSGLTVSFGMVSGPATISGNTITITGVGTVVVRASQSGDANFNAALDVDQSFTVAKASQTITFNALSSKSYGDVPFNVSATSSSGLVVSFGMVSGPATISGNTITITGVGTVVVRASQSGDANFNAALDVDQSFTVAKASQTITFNALSSKSYGDVPFNVSATSSSDLTVSFGIVSGPATISGNSITITGAGTVAVRAAQSGDANFNAATVVDQSFTVAKASQTIAFNALSSKSYGDVPFNVSATSSSDLTVSFSILSGPATISGNTIAITGVGTVTVRASQSGDANFNAATVVDESFIVAKADQTITFNALSSKTYGDVPFNVSATSSSDLTVGFSVLSGPATISGNTIAITGVGTVTVRASQSGDANFNAATVVDESFIVAKADQTITFNALSSKTYGDVPFNVSATSSSDLTVGFSVLSGPATISGNTIAITGVGTVAVRSSQAGNGSYNAAIPVDGSFTVYKASQTISFGPLPSKTFGEGPFILAATSSSDLLVSFQILSGPANISGNTVSITGTGTVMVRATQAGNGDYNAAALVDQPFDIVSANAAISLSNLSHTYDGTAKFATATTNPANLNVSITYSHDGSPVSSPTSSGAYDVTATITSPGSNGTTTGTLVINKALTVITWNNPSNIVSGTPLSGAQLNATSDVSGNFSYNPLPGTVLSAGTYQLSVLFTPLDLSNYNTAAASVQLTVDPAIVFSSATYSVNESVGSVTLTVTRDGDLTQPASVEFATSDTGGAQDCNVVNGVASSRCDYEIRLKTVRFLAGESSKIVSVFIIDDTYLENPESFTVSLSNPVGAVLGAQSTATVTISDNEITNGVNPIDTTSFFLRPHYLDFLNREPDSSGLAYWTSKFTACGGNQQCINDNRINVSAAFYLSIEFQQTGYLVERIYKTAYGDGVGTSTVGGTHQVAVPIVRLLEFLHDTQEIGEGVVVGQPGWETVLESNKQTSTAEFVQSSRFTTAFPTSMTAAQFVDTLNANAGNPLSTSERNQLVSDLSTAAKTRAQVLRAVAEDPDLLNGAEFSRAFVLMQYFGYLRRNPDDPQDSDHTGYDYWLTKLNLFNGNFTKAEMVKAFITSIEYRQRFGP